MHCMSYQYIRICTHIFRRPNYFGFQWCHTWCNLNHSDQTLVDIFHIYHLYMSSCTYKHVRHRLRRHLPFLH